MPYATDDDSRRVALNECKKIFIQRDYSNGMEVRFNEEYPQELQNKIDEQSWTRFMRELNENYHEAETVTKSSIFENILGFASCYLTRLCLRSVWDKKLKHVEELIQEANAEFAPRGVYVLNPIEKGFRTIEVALLDEPLPTPNHTQPANSTTPMLQPR